MTAYPRKCARILATLAAMMLMLAGPAMAQGSAGQEALRAGVVALHRQKVPVTVPLTGQAAARSEAEIRPLVDGIVTSIIYQPGSEVKAGDPLFTIDPRSYQADLDSAQAQLESARAALPAAEATAERFERLAGTGVTQADVDQARVTLLQARAAISQAEASLATARINLDRTTITSPIDGVAGIPETSVGDLVTSGQSAALTTVTALDPIYVDLSAASSQMLQTRARIASGDMDPGDHLNISIRLENGEVYDGTGIVRAISSTVSTTTGTIRIRVEFENPRQLILPGMFVRASVTVGTADAFLIPQLAATLEPDGRISVWTLNGESEATEVTVTPAGSSDNAWIVTQGLEDGARIIVDNCDAVSEGTTSQPVEARVNDLGVVEETGN
ncbi:efflux RND transporter periplasmic adaptor subunit [Falsirhodobacter deserti]|uniref:efflux RND transporter periplasmic adaptor subunit n=1 Tax=Falsirhodobacter deserti TaxID=1365611 RepID=UPI000FE2E5B2|nr:efflux RND transporter periplasmic adaptor subunit [Falsirhodobacter deserti]